VLSLAGCGEPERDNPLDPWVSRTIDLQEEIIGSWGRDDAEKNEVYTFKVGGRVELRDFSSPSGGAVDRNAPFPQTLVVTLAGTYELTGSVLRLSFTQAQSNDPSGRVPSLPGGDRQVVVGIRRDVLTVQEADGVRQYTRL
jgi:hypothetical protein